MKKQTLLNGLLLTGMLSVTLLMNSCGMPAYKKAIPADALAVMEVDLKSVGLKSDFMSQRDELADWLLQTAEPGDRAAQKIADILRNPLSSGIDWLKPAYMFVTSSVDNGFIVAAVKNQENLIKVINSLSDEVEISDSGDVAWIMYRGKYVVGALTSNTLIIGMDHSASKGTYRDMLQQPEEKCFFASEAGKLMSKHLGDATAMLNLKSLSPAMKREVRRELENESGIQNMDEVWDKLLSMQLVVNLESKSGKLALNLLVAGTDNESKPMLSKKVDPMDLQKIPNKNLVGLLAIGLDGKAFWDAIEQEMGTSVNKLSSEERDIYNMIGTALNMVNGTMIASIGGYDVMRNPEFIFVLPASKTMVKTAISLMGEDLPRGMYLEGNNAQSTITNIATYDAGSVSSPFDKASDAGSSYVYAYVKAEPFFDELFKDMTRGADREEMKIYTRLRALCNLADYAELRAEKHDEASLAIYLNDDSKNPLAFILSHGIKIGNAVVEYDHYRHELYKSRYQSYDYDEDIEEVAAEVADWDWD